MLAFFNIGFRTEDHPTNDDPRSFPRDIRFQNKVAGRNIWIDFRIIPAWAGEFHADRLRLFPS
jgi:hypothetical protein